MTRRTWSDRGLALGLAVFALVGLWRELAAFPGDVRAREWVAAHPVLPSGIRDLSTLLSALGTPFVALLTLVVLCWPLARRWGRREAVGIALAALAVVVAELSQDLLGQGTEQTIPTAYPSGHVVWATAVFGLLALRARRHGVAEIALPALAVVVLMGPERIVTGAHGISDVLGGYGLGLAWALAVDRWVDART